METRSKTTEKNGIVEINIEDITNKLLSLSSDSKKEFYDVVLDKYINNTLDLLNESIDLLKMVDVWEQEILECVNENKQRKSLAGCRRNELFQTLIILRMKKHNVTIEFMAPDYSDDYPDNFIQIKCMNVNSDMPATKKYRLK